MSRLIVSFTSHPARITSVKKVLDSLYAQTLPADEIILWLAEEEFPKKDADLPRELQDDLSARKFTLRWCNNLGSHKKYFYVMQEYPEDIIVTVDDDTFYHPDSLERLMETHRRFPNAVAAFLTTMVQFDQKLEPLPFNQWLFDFRQIQKPSMLLMAVGCGGTLFPPHSVNPRIFDVQLIKDTCSGHGKIYGDDLLLKAGEMLNHTPVVFVANRPYYRLPNTQGTALAKILPNLEHNNLVIERIKERFGAAFTERDTTDLKKAVATFKQLDQRDRLIKKYWLKRPSRELEKQIGYLSLNDGPSTITPSDYDEIKTIVRLATRVFCAYPPKKPQDKSTEAMDKFIQQVIKIPGIEQLAKQDLIIRGVIEYKTLLSTSSLLIYRGIPVYMQSIQNWINFLDAHPQCDVQYYKAFRKTLSGINQAIKKAGNAIEPTDANAWDAIYRAGRAYQARTLQNLGFSCISKYWKRRTR